MINKKKLKDDIIRLITANKIINGGYIRITLYRGKGGKYKPNNNNASYIITSSFLEENLFLIVIICGIETVLLRTGTSAS